VAGFFPLDEALGLLPSQGSPRWVEAVVRLGTLLPFEQVPEQVAFFTGSTVSRETARRLTEAAGAALDAVEAAEVDALELTVAEPLAGPAVQQLSADGAMVPLVGGQWSEVKLLTVGTVDRVPAGAGVERARTSELSYFARLAAAEQFGRLATLETHRRGTARAGRVAAVLDGAMWLQGLVDLQRPDAVRILDFPHAAEHLGTAATAVWGEGSAQARDWLGGWLHEFKHGEPAEVLAAIGRLPAAEAADPTAAGAAVQQTLDYLASRWAQIQYAQFRAQGLPIGSGCVESGHKQVMQTRLKGPGMHWAASSVNPLLSLRCALCNGRWSERWGRLAQRWRAGAPHVCRRRARRGAEPAPAAVPESGAAAASVPVAPARPAPAPLIVNGRPTAAHPWKRRCPLPRSGAPSPAKL
jgi:hypothetical protein